LQVANDPAYLATSQSARKKSFSNAVTSSNPNQHRQITLDYGVFATETSSIADKNSVDSNDDLQRATRVPTGVSFHKTLFSASLTL
jgi:hypothetical protein